ncbi:hypothetical protein LP420_37455 [Massilia sp. B-10]|nr:hypothetical protein LP420_37455 [Massilia sp. B-10]
MASRVVKTCSTAGCTALGDFSISTVSQAALGASNAVEQSTLVDWAKGQNLAKGSDPTGELGKPTTIMRPSSHGDVIHSNPLAMSYSTSDPAAPDVVVYYGSNDGMLHAINGNQTRNIASTTPGKELWAFMPPEFFGNIKRLYTNSERINIALPLPQVAHSAPETVRGGRPDHGLQEQHQRLAVRFHAPRRPRPVCVQRDQQGGTVAQVARRLPDRQRHRLHHRRRRHGPDLVGRASGPCGRLPVRRVATAGDGRRLR